MGRNVEESGPAINEIWSRHILTFPWSYWQKSRKYSSQGSRVRLKLGSPRYEAEAPSTTQLMFETYHVRNLNKNWHKHKSKKTDRGISFSDHSNTPSASQSVHICCDSATVSDNGLTTGKWDGRVRGRSFVLRISSLVSVQSYINWIYYHLHLYNHTVTEDIIICIPTITY